MIPATYLLDDFQKAEALLAQGDLRSAADLCKQILDTNPAFAHGYHLMSALFRTTGNFQKALNFSQLAIRIEPTIAAFHFQQGQVCFALGDWEGAREASEKASQLDAAHPLYLLLWADALAQQKHYGQAQALFVRARAISDMPEIDEHEGLFLLASGDIARAEQLFDRLTIRQPDYFPGYIHKGKLLLARRQDMQAHACFAKALNINPQAHEAMHYMALIAEKSGDTKTAIHFVMQAVHVNPSLLPSLLLLGLLLLRMQDYASAEQVFKQTLTLQSDHPEVIDGLIASLAAQRRLHEILPYLDAVLALQPAHANMQHFKAMFSGHTPDAPPASYVTAMFDGHIYGFDEYLQNIPAYPAAALLADTVSALPQFKGETALSLLDLGCGGGGVAAAMKPYTRTRIGVDLSEHMLEKARGSRLYDELYALDITEFVTGCDRTFDVAAAGDVLMYVGNPRTFLRAARGVLGPQSVLAFTIEKEESLVNFRLNLTGRYSHSPDYITLLAHEEGYRIAAEKEVVLRMEHGQAVRGMLYIFQKLQLH